MILILTILPLLAVVAVLVFRGRKVVRFIAVAAIALAILPIPGFLIAPHRLAEERRQASPPSEEWRQGASATRDEVYLIFPTLSSAVIALVILALVNGKTEPSSPPNSFQPTASSRG